MSLYQHLHVHAKAQPGKTAIECDCGELSFRQLHVLTDQCVEYFQSAGLKPGDRVAILALNHPDWFIALFAAAKSGIVLVPMNWRLSVEELAFVVCDSTPSLLLHDKEFTHTAVAVQEQLSATDSAEIILGTFGSDDFPQQADSHSSINATCDSNENDPLLLVYTSGTTGRPKGAVLSEKALRCSAEMSRHMLALAPDDRVLNVLPLFHVGGLNIQPLPALLCGATLVLPSKFDPHAAVQLLQEKQITLITVVPTILQSMLESSKWDMSEFKSLRALSIGSTDVPVSLINEVQKDNIPVLQVYGATETAPVAIYQTLEDTHKVGSIGRAGSRCEIKLVNENGDEVPDGESGEILVKGENILSCYWNNELATSENIKDGWFSTGDVAHQDDDGYFWFDDRVKHVVISGGENIYPAELERVIRDLPGVEELAVVGKPDERWGEVPVVVIAGTADKQSVLDACSQLAKFKRPRDVIFVDALPKNALGKVQVQKVRALLFP